MMTFRNHRLRDFSVPMSTNWMLNDLAEAKGKQELFTRQSPQLLKALREMALVQSVESSNRIEGVTVAPDRLRPLVLGHARPKDRSEQEIAGYHVLQQSSQRWHDGKHEFLPWLNHFLAIGRRGYGEFEKRAGDVKSKRGAKSALVEAALESFLGDFTLADIERACPGVSRDLIRRLLWQKQKDGLLECLNRGPGAVWRKKVKFT
jgi:hypothetical protein